MSDQRVSHWRIREFGVPAEKIERVETVLGALASGEVCVKMLASPVNPADLNFIEGTYGIRPSLPTTPGLEGLGCVLESRAEGFVEGDWVILLSGAGAWAREINVPAERLLKIPSGMDPLQASMLKVNPQTANRILLDFVDLVEGDWIAQNAANSGVGRSLIQLAKRRGLRTLNLVRRAELINELQSLGADEVILDTRQAVDEWKERNAGVQIKLASNSVGGDSALRLMNLLMKNGTLVTYGAMARQPLKVPNGLLIFKGLALRGLWVTDWIRDCSREELEKSYCELANYMAEGELMQAVDEVFDFEDLPQALRRASESRRAGKVLLRF